MCYSYFKLSINEVTLFTTNSCFYCLCFPVTLSEGTIFREIVLQACSEIGFTPHIAFEGNDIDALKGLVSAGLGVALMPEVTLVDNIQHSTVKIPLVDPEVTRTVGVIIPTQRKLLPTEQLFYRFLSEFFASADQSGHDDC